MPNPSSSFVRAAALGLLLSVHAGTFAAPVDADAPSSSLPQSSADLVGRLLTARGWFADADSSSVDAGLFGRMRGSASEMVTTAMNFVGVRYRRGGSTAESGFDCSGFTRQVFESSVGLLLPRRADEQARAAGLTAVDRDELVPGDLVFFNTLRRTFSHVGIYLGDNKFIHSPSVGGEVRVDDMRYAYWARRYTGARRAPLEGAVPSGDVTYPIR